MKINPSLAAGLLALCVSALLPAGAAPKPVALPRSTPEAQGVSSSGVLAFVDAADQTIDAMHSLMIVRHGHVIAEGWWSPYDRNSNHELFSLSKSFTSTAVGLAVAEGRLSLDDEVLKFFPEDAPAQPSDNLKSMRIRDLLSMSTGHQDEPPTSWDKVSPKSFLGQPVPFKPGTHFKYNTAATFMLSAIVQKQTGQTVVDYLQPRLFEPLGIMHPVWKTNFQGVSLGGYGLRVGTEDIARFGQLYLQKGRWQGRQILSPDWVAQATSRQTSNGSSPKSDWDQGYGYQFWRCRHGAYRGDGAFGQYCIVLPEQDAVIAITSGVKDMQAVLNLVWDKLLPVFSNHRLSADKPHRQQLEQRLQSLSVKLPEGGTASTELARIAGRRFVFPANDSKLEALRLEPGGRPDELKLTTWSEGAEEQSIVGLRRWTKGPFRLAQFGTEPQAAAAAWSGSDTLAITSCAVETPFHRTLRLRFEGNEVRLESAPNVGFNGTKPVTAVGRAD